jgi:hypothetical protein
MNFVQSTMLSLFTATACVTSTYAGNGNDDCESAEVITAGTVTALVDDYCPPHIGECSTDFDWYRITVPAGRELLVTLLILDIDGQAWPYLALSDGGATGGCPTQQLAGLAEMPGSSGLAYSWHNLTGGPREVYMSVWCYGSKPEGYVSIDYSLVTTLYTSNCVSHPDDGFSPNHTVSAARPLTESVQTDLFVKYTSPDWFEVLVPGFGSMTATATFTGTIGDVDLRMLGQGLPSSTGTGDVESVTWTNSDANARSMFLSAYIKEPHFDQCSEYQLALDISSLYGTEYCPAAENSFAIGAQLTLDTSPSATAPSWRWLSFGTRPFTSVQLFCGNQQTSIPFGDGVRCVGGSLFRLGTTVPVTTLAAFTVQSANLPAALQFQPGATWNFQTIYRDLAGPLGNGFNLSNGVAVTFLP